MSSGWLQFRISSICFCVRSRSSLRFRILLYIVFTNLFWGWFEHAKKNEIIEISIYQFGIISKTEIIFDQEIRKICEDNVCRLYGKSWACPPAVGTVDDWRQYARALVFNAVYPLDNSFDYEGMIRGHSGFKDLCSRLYTVIKPQLHFFLILSNEGCKRCKNCTYPSVKCRNSEMLSPSLEGFGSNVAKLEETANLKYMNENIVTYFGMLLY